MYTTLRTLIVDEEFSNLVELMDGTTLQTLRSAGFDVYDEQVATYHALSRALAGNHWNVVIYNMKNIKISPLEVIDLIKQFAPSLLVLLVLNAEAEEWDGQLLEKLYPKNVHSCNQKNLAATLISNLRLHQVFPDVSKMNKPYSEHEELLYITLSSIGDGIITTDIMGNINFVNRAAEAIIGYQSDYSMGKPLSEIFRLVDSSTGEDIENPFVRVMLSNKTVGLQKNTILIDKNGNEKFISASSAPIRNKQSHIIGVVIAFRDITRMRETEQALKENEERYRNLFENASDMIYIHDLNGRLTSVNRGAEELTGYNKQELMHMNIDQLLAPESRETAYQMIITRITEKTTKLIYELCLVNKQGKIVDVEVNSQLIFKDGIADGIMGIVRDISARKQAQRELQAAKKTAEMNNRAKSEFLANMSHEIRTPLNGIMGMTDLTLLSDLDEDQKENLMIVKACTESLKNVINDILDFSKIEAGKLTLEKVKFNIREMIDSTLKPHIVNAMSKNLWLNHEIDPGIPAFLIGDPTRLQQVLNNLIGNAVKFTEAGGVSLRVVRQEIKADKTVLRFEITDTGIGIDDDEMEKLFKSFSQVDGSINRRYGGTGLGLAISKRLIEMMAGDIWVVSKKGKGSKFNFTVVCESAAIVDIEQKALAEKPDLSVVPHQETYPKVRILYVEDDKASQIMTTRLLKLKGYDVLVAENGQEAVALFKKENIDLILMDIMMPSIDGIEATRLIREQESGGKHIPIVALTARAIQGDREKFLSAGMDEYLSKPFNASDLFDTIEKMIIVADAPENHLENLTSHFGKLRKAIADQDKIKVEQLAHTIKSLAAQGKAEEVKNKAFKIELAARKNDFEAIFKQYELLDEEIVKLCVLNHDSVDFNYPKG